MAQASRKALTPKINAAPLSAQAAWPKTALLLAPLGPEAARAIMGRAAAPWPDKISWMRLNNVFANQGQTVRAILCVKYLVAVFFQHLVRQHAGSRIIIQHNNQMHGAHVSHPQQIDMRQWGEVIISWQFEAWPKFHQPPVTQTPSERALLQI